MTERLSDKSFFLSHDCNFDSFDLKKDVLANEKKKLNVKNKEKFLNYLKCSRSEDNNIFISKKFDFSMFNSLDLNQDKTIKKFNIGKQEIEDHYQEEILKKNNNFFIPEISNHKLDKYKKEISDKTKLPFNFNFKNTQNLTKITNREKKTEKNRKDREGNGNLENQQDVNEQNYFDTSTFVNSFLKTCSIDKLLNDGNKLVRLLKNNKIIITKKLFKKVICKIQFMFYHDCSEIRAVAFKILRYFLVCNDSLITLINSNFYIFIIISMSIFQSTLLEKEEMLKLIRQFLIIKDGHNVLNIGIIKSIISLIKCDQIDFFYNVDFDTESQNYCKCKKLNHMDLNLSQENTRNNTEYYDDDEPYSYYNNENNLFNKFQKLFSTNKNKTLNLNSKIDNFDKNDQNLSFIMDSSFEQVESKLNDKKLFNNESLIFKENYTNDDFLNNSNFFFNQQEESYNFIEVNEKNFSNDIEELKIFDTQFKKNQKNENINKINNSDIDNNKKKTDKFNEGIREPKSKCTCESQSKSFNVISDGFKNACFETLCEISLFKPDLIYLCGGFKLITDMIVDGPIEISINCLFIFLKMLDCQSTRKFLRNGFDLNSLIAIFTNSNDDETYKKLHCYKLQKASFLITILLKNFNGLVAFSIDNFKILTDLISALKKKNITIRDYIIDIIFDILRIKTLPWLLDCPIADFLVKFNQFQDDSIDPDNIFLLFKYLNLNEFDDFEYSIINHYRGLLTLFLIKKNLINFLNEIVNQNLNKSNTEKAIVLITYIYEFSNNLLPREIIDLDTLFPVNSTNSLTFQIEKFIKSQIRQSHNNEIELNNKINTLNMKSECIVDDIEFKSLIYNTKVLFTKDFNEWNWNLLFFLVNVTLKNPKRLDEVIEKNPKFFKRILSFFRPFKYKFCNIPYDKPNQLKIVNFGSGLFKLLLNQKNGFKYLSSNKIIPQLAEIFAQIDPFSGLTAKNPILSNERLKTSLSVGYLLFIGDFSSFELGLKLLDKWQFFNYFHNIIESSMDSMKNDILIVNLFINFDFSLDDRFKILLYKCLQISNDVLKIFLIKKLIPTFFKINQCKFFVIKLLINTLYDKNDELVDISISLLMNNNILDNKDCLEYFIKRNPPIGILSTFQSGKILLIELLKTEIGFKYLELFDFIETEFNVWKNFKGFDFLKAIEKVLNDDFLPYISNSDPSKKKNIVIFYDNEEEVNSSSIEFFKNLLSTEEGLMCFLNPSKFNFLLKLVDEIDSISKKIKSLDFMQFDTDNKNSFYVNTLKQNLWMIGVISSGKFGIHLLDPLYNSRMTKSVFLIIIDLFYTCQIWQIRGVCFFVLGLISSTMEGIKILDDLNWISVSNNYLNGKSLCYPKQDINKIFDIKIINPFNDLKLNLIPDEDLNLLSFNHDYIFTNDKVFSVDSLTSNEVNFLMSKEDGDVNIKNNKSFENQETDFPNSNLIHNKIIFLICQLSSVFGKIERNSAKELKKLKKNHSQIFEELELFFNVVEIINKGNFSFTKRNFIFNLFLDGKLIEKLMERDKI